MSLLLRRPTQDKGLNENSNFLNELCAIEL